MKQIQIRKWNAWLLLPTLLLTLLTSGCRTIVKQTIPEIPVPLLQQIAERPTLEPIPSIDTTGWSEAQCEQLILILEAYDRNTSNLVVYTIELEGYTDAAETYIERLKSILSGSEE